MSSLIEELSVSLIHDDSDENRKKWAKYIIAKNIPLKELIDLLDFEKRVATRFMWLVGDICELKPRVVFPTITYFFSKRKTIHVTNFNRSLAKMFWLAGVPKEIEGQATTEMFNWMMDPNVIVSTKNYSILALSNLATKYSELKNELKLVIEDQLPKSSVSFKKCAKKVLAQINEL